ncbi:FKBP-type peptidyl-prolyl cis-trans isomerase [Desulfohalobium retbaense]|uniref:Peptidyl-prolyl cis-trans isomerase n=1 Tax=Desulfohalobium retbaense (strain ATCC 49708 / DSM 5692 / JCM 16813 / HR100) TaxID=485915 RepID=C8X2G9_DESRD|nr:FKBP-type peptidyl-prolyl cis-trans isomerase [Desulfohalobium retbaense]ACV68616.1 Peptidylprolyl isomerase [Desulfohalobium retbaense DSM 5692]
MQRWLMLCLVGGVVFLAACQQSAQETPQETTESAAVTLDTDQDKVSYGLGMDIGNKLKSQEFDLDPDLAAQGLKDALSGNETLMTPEEVQQSLQALQQRLLQEQQKKQQETAAKNAEAGRAFLEANKAKEGVQTTESGLQYKVVEKGDGPQPDADDVVTVHYTGKLVNGTVFDSSRERGKPATFPVNGVIPGWTEALQMMHEGAQWQVVLPADLAYGARQAGPQIGPNSTLVFDVELLEVQKKDTEANATAQQ